MNWCGILSDAFVIPIYVGGSADGYACRVSIAKKFRYASMKCGAKVEQQKSAATANSESGYRSRVRNAGYSQFFGLPV